MRYILVIVLSLTIVAVASAEIYLPNYKADKNDDTQMQLNQIYIYGVGIGYAWANAELRRTGSRPLYCQPSDLALTLENYISILDDTIERYEKQFSSTDSEGQQLLRQTPVEYLLLLGLETTFPCE